MALLSEDFNRWKKEINDKDNYLNKLLDDTTKHSEELKSVLSSSQYDIIEQTLMRFVNSLTDAAFFVNSDFNVYYMNNIAKEILNCDDEWESFSLFNIFPKEENRLLVEAFKDADNIISRENFLEEYYMKDGDGELIPVTVTVSTQLHSSDELYYIMLVKDLSAWKEKVRYLRALKEAFQNSNDRVAIMKLDGEVTYYNNAFFEQYGDDVETLIGKNFMDLRNNNEFLGNYITEEIIEYVKDGNIWRCDSATYIDGGPAKIDLALIPIYNGGKGYPVYILYYQLGNIK